MFNFAVIVFPGSNCDHDCYSVIKHIFGQNCELVWHQENDLKGFDCIVIPGGFSYGDYLRPGAIAKYSPVMKAIEALVPKNTPILGICNGFQILVEAGLLPGCFIKNSSLKFVCKWVSLKIKNDKTPFTYSMKQGDIIKIPIAHADGNYFAAQSEILKLKKNSAIVFEYCDENGKTMPESNPNGSKENIAGISNSKGNIVGMMPHPERCCDELIGGEQGKLIFESVINWLENSRTKNKASNIV